MSTTSLLRAGAFELTHGAQIDTREELLAALAVAAELEHGLLAQYLFAGYSLKKWPERITFDQVDLARKWEAVILAVARDEMVHFATVTKIASAIGGFPHVNRPAFPMPEGSPFPFAMRLRAFGLPEIERFIRFETPADAIESNRLEIIAPELPEYHYIGELYRQIRDAITTMAEQQGDAWLFVGPPEAGAEDVWGLRHNVRGIKDAASAAIAIDEVIAEGEGADRATASSHWMRFKAIRDDLLAELGRTPEFEPARRVVPDPVTKPHRDGTLLVGGSAGADLAELFNHVYGTLLLLIVHYFAPIGETKAQRDGIKATIRRAMSGVLRPLAECLTDVVIDGAADTRAGPPFETYGAIEPAISVASRFAVLDERVDREALESLRLAASAGLPRLVFIGENLTIMRDALRVLGAGGEVNVDPPRV